MNETNVQSTVEAATREALLGAAEVEFGERGFHGTSLRRITARAGANLASVNYHFGSKEKLFAEAWARRVRPINRRRMAELEALMARQGAPPELAEVLEIYIRPLVELGASAEPWCAAFQRLAGRMVVESESFSRQIFEEEIGPVAEAFAAACARVDPALSRREVFWALFFLSGSMFFTLNAAHKIERLSHGLANPRDTETTIRLLTAYGVAGFRSLIGAAPGPTDAPDC